MWMLPLYLPLCTFGVGLSLGTETLVVSAGDAVCRREGRKRLICRRPGESQALFGQLTVELFLVTVCCGEDTKANTNPPE